MSFPQWQQGQANPEIPVNEAFDILRFLATFGRDPETTSGLTWGYLGGPWGDLVITSDTVSLTPSTTNYLVVNRVTGAVSVSTSTTNWNNTSAYARIYSINAGAVTVSSFTDYRGAVNGVLGPRSYTVSGLPVGADKDLLQYDSGTGEWVPVTLNDVLPVATTNQLLKFDGTNWVAYTPTTGGGGGTISIPVAMSDETSALVAGTVVGFRMPHAMNITKIKASLVNSCDGGPLTIKVYHNGTPVFSTNLTVDDFETTSESAVVPAVLSLTSFEDDAYIEIEIFSVGSSAPGSGLKVYLVGTSA